MKKIFLTLLSLSFFSLLSIAQEQCLTDNKHKKLLLEDSSYSQRYYSFFNQVNSNLGLNSNQAFILQGDTDTLEVPLVVHIIHKGEAVGVGSNIADSQIIDAVNVLNDRFRKTPGTHGDGNGVDTKIQFVLAKRAPNCDSTNGIVRVNGSSVAGYSANGITSTNEIQIKALSRWPSSNYVNIWVVSEIDGNNGGFGTQGYAYFPGASPQVDGIVVMNTCFGTIGTVNAWNNLNRTLTHELGHYFGLFHTFEGDSLGNQCPPIVNGCGSDLGDCCGDTEHHIRAASNCPVGINGCTSAAWAGVEDNYMNYSNQSCATDFTANQSARMRATLLSARAGLLTSYGYVDPPLSSITAASCSPNTTNLANNSGIGIRNVSIGDVLNVSTSTAVRDSGYLDFTCTQIISLDTGVAYDIEVLTGFFNDEDVRVYLDYNNDGDFLDTAELIFSNNADTFHQGSFTPYSLLVLNDTLRLRIISDWFNNNITGPCYTPEYGQVEDYAVVFAADSLDSFAVTSTSTQNQSCPDSADGEITITAIGPGPIVYSILGFNNGYADTNLTGQFTDLVPDFYIVSVGDSSLGTDTTFSLTVAPSFFGFLNPPFNQLVDPSCDNACDGDARSRPNVLGTTPYTYLWSNGETSAKAFNLCGGTATVSITDASGCTISQSVTLIEPPSIFVTVDSTDSVTCNGGADGAAYISGHGGTVGSDSTNFYIIDQTEGEFEPYGVGESFNTSNYQSFTLGDDQLTGSLNIGFNFEFFGNTQTTFRISSNGNIQFGTAVSNTWQNVSIPNANNPDNWIGVWDDLNPSATTSEVIETYLAGTSPNRARVINYVDVPHYQSGTAQYTFQIVLYETSNIIQIHSTTIPNFNEGGAFPGTTMGIENADGSFGYAVPGRNGVNFSATNDYVTFIPLTQNFTYSWSSIGTGSSATNLTAGTYTVTAADGSCSDTASFTILEPDPITVDSTITNPTCVGDTDGAITVNANGGNGGPFTYAWSTGGNTATISNLAAGTYTVTVTDVEGCTEVIAITLDDPDPVVASINVDDNVSCFGGSDGQLTASGSGGAGGFTYLWNTTASTPTIGSLSAGTYTVTVTDANGCTDVDSEVITEPTLLTFSINSVTNVSCFGGTDGAITANAASGGTTPYTYLWSSGGTALGEGSLSAGTYTITVTDGNGCTATADTTITEPATGVTISIASATTLDCFGDTDASITANAASGGTSPYSYLWSSGGTGLTETGLGAGTYTITVTDAGGCLDSADTTITEPTQLVIDTTSVSGPSCVGGTNGSITVAATGGTPGYTYTWNTTATGPTLSGLSAGTYTVTATDNNGCEGIDSVTLTNGNGVQATITLLNDPSCAGTLTGSIAANALNASLPFNVSYIWNTGSTSNLQFSVAAGTYTVTVTDNNTGCEDDTTVTLTDPPVLSISIIDSLNPTCGNTDGEAEALATGGTGSLTYSWISGGNAALETGLGGGTYTVTVTDSNGCLDSAEVTLVAPTAFTATGSELASESCTGNDGQATVNMVGGNMPFSFVWSNGDTTQTIIGLAANTYTVTVTDASGCTDTAVAIVADSCLCNWTASGVLVSDVLCNGDSTGSASVTHAGAANPVTYLWSTGSTNDSLVNVPVGTYTVTVTDNDACVDTAVVVIDEPATALVINSFSNISAPTCDNDCDGAATVNASGGTGTMTYAWSSGGSAASVTGLCGGGHYVTVTDNNGCEAVDLIALVERPVIFAQVDSTDSVSCPGNNDGAAFLSAHGGFATSSNTGEYIIDQTEGSFEPYPTGRPWNAINYKTFPLQDDATSDTINIFSGDTFEFFGVGHTHFIMNSQGFITFDLSNPNSGQVNGQFSTTSAIPSAAANSPKDFIAAYWHDLDPTVPSCTLETYLVGTAPNRIRVVNYIEIDHWSNPSPGIISTFQIVLYETSNIIQIHSDSLNSDGGGHVQGIENFAGTSAYAVPGRNNTNFSAANDYVAFIPITQNFTYTWSSIGSGPSDTTLTAGNYTVTVSDGTCSDTAQFEIFEPDSGLTVSMAATNSLCFVASGSVSATVTNGTAPYTYVWSNATTTNTTNTSDTITGLSSGPYSVTVTDANGCQDSNSAVVNDLFAPAVTASVIQDASCANTCDGIVVADFTCFTCGPAEWFVFPDTTTVIGTGDTLTGRCAGTYLVRITTGFGCSRFDTIGVTAPLPLQLVMDSTDAACSGSATGGAEVTVSGGTAPYDYLWSTGGTNDTIDNQVAGTYTVTVTDDNGCSDTAEVEILQGTDLIASATLINDVTCPGGSDGSAIATQVGGSAPFNYEWSDASTNDTISGVPAGTYFVTITGANGCEDSASVVIGQPDTFAFAFTETPISCGGAGNDGGISVVVTGGNGGNSYAWSNSGTGTSINSLTAGIYTVVVTDGSGCQDSASYDLLPPGAFSVDVVDSSDVLCFGDVNGTAVVQALVGGSGLYTFAWDNGETTDTANALDAGLHTVTVTDTVSGCIDSADVIIGTPGVLVLVVDSIDSVNCLGGSDGVICVTASGGIPPYDYGWSNGATTQCANGLAAGTYTVTVTDSNNCVAVIDTVVGEPATGVVAGVLIADSAQCNGDSAMVVATGTGGSGVYTFLWPGGMTNDTVMLPAGNYCVTVSDGGACTDTACITVVDPTAITASATQNLPTCPGGNDGELTASATGGTPGYSYLWFDGSTNPTITGLSAGAYGLTVTDANGCQDSTVITLLDPTGMSATFSNINTSSCGSCNGSATANITGGLAPYDFNWLTGGSTTQNGTSLCPGQNLVEVTDDNGCIDTFSVNIPTLGADTVVASVIQNALCNGGNEGSGFASYTCSVNPCTVEWYDLLTSTLQGTTDTITGLTAGDYYVQLTNDSGCVSFDTITITEPTAVVAAIDTSGDVSCPGGSDGFANASATGGTVGAGGYSFVWSNGATGANLAGVPSGVYCVTVTDANGCQDSICVTIDEPAAGISVLATVLQDVTCNGGSDGIVTAMGSNGTPPYTYTWNGTLVADTLFNQPAGQYIVAVSDGGPCTATDTVNIIEPSEITAVFNNVQDPSCPGDTNGQATVSVSGGTPGYTYLWPNGSTDSTATGLPDGTYCVTVTDAAGCQDTFCVDITDPAGMTNTFTGVTNSSCTVCDGTATANPVGGNGGPYTFLWSNGQTSATNDSLCAGLNSVTITDVAGCELIVNIPINADSADSVVAGGFDPTCGNCDGIVFATYTCTSAPCTVEWTDLATMTVIGTTDTIDSLCAGSYSVELTNAQGCVSSSIITLDPPVPVDPNELVSDVSCFGSCDGSIALSPTGGSGTYTYAWSTGDTAATISGLCGGSYTVTISDGAGCDTIASFDVDEPTEILANATVQDASCGNLCDGQINTAPSGGAGGYSFNWSPVPSNGNGTSLADSLCGGFYFLTITDANGCTSVDTFTIFQPTPIVQDTVVVTDATCGDCDGEIDPTFSGGAGGYTFNWTTGATSNAVDSLCFGFYEVTVTDVDGCSEMFGYPVSETGGPGVNITSTNATANGACDGTATANITSSLGTPVYVWSNGDTTQTADSLCAGTYIVTVTDTNGCSTVDTITITEPTIMTLSFNVTEITCAGTGCDGEIEAVVSGGTQPYTYAWSSGDTSAVISGLCAGTYIVTATDFNGQILIDSVVLTDPVPFDLTADIQNVTCPGECDGSIELTALGGGPISIIWTTGDTTNMIMDLCPGIYGVTVSDTAGCIDSAEFTIDEPAALTITVDSITNPDCQVANGMIAVTASGGTGSTYSYQWLDIAGDPLIPAQTTAMATNLFAGIYNVEVTDSNGCMDTFNIILNNANAPVITLDSLNDVSCFGDCDGEIYTSITGGTLPYNILWSNGETTDDIDSLCAGSDTLVVTDSNFCISIEIFEIDEPAEINVDSVSITHVTCGADCDGSISIDSISGGTAPFSFAWSTGETGSSLTDLCAGPYGVTITDANGCTFQTVFNVNGPAPLVITLDSLGNATCTNTGDGQIEVTVTGGSAPYTYQWVYEGTDTLASQDILGALAGNYVLTVFDTNGCSISDTFDVEATFFVEVEAMDDLDVCPHSTGVVLTATQQGAGSTRWLFTNGTMAGTGNSLTVNTTTDTSIYIFEGINGVCVDRDTVVVAWTEGPGIDAGPDRFIEPGQSTEIGGSPTANTGIDVVWTPAKDITDVTEYNPIVNPLETTVYYVSATDPEGCFGIDSAIVTVEEVVDPVGGFSPNGDGVNDGFIIDRIEDYPNAVVQIYNRWGNLIYESPSGYTIPWDGTYKGKSLPVGTYYYVINLNDPDITRLITGPVTILK